MYDLSVDGVRDLARYTNLIGQRKRSRDPMSGLVDGINATFHTQYAPILTSGSVAVFNSSGAQVLIASIDYDTGEVVLPSAPNYQPVATYTYTPYTTWQLKSFLMSGFDEMQNRWPRPNWYLSSSSVALTAPTEDSTTIYVVVQNVSNAALTDPACSGSLVFSALRNQINFYMACCEYVYVSRQMEVSAETGVAFRETRGAALDRQDIAKNIDLRLDRLEKRLIMAMTRAQDEYYSGGDHLGAVLSPEHTRDYTTNYDWHSNVSYPSDMGGFYRLV